MRKLVIFGLKDVARIAARVFAVDGGYDVVAFTADREYWESDTVDGHPVVDYASLAETHPPETHDLFVGISYGNMNRNRSHVTARARAAGYTLGRYISPRASVWADTVGDNVLIMENVVIQPFCTVGNNVFIWPSTVVVHHTVVGPDCYIGPLAFIGGNCTIGEGSVIGPQSIIASQHAVGARNFIGAGSRIYTDTSDDALYVGPGSKPARVTTDRMPLALARRLFNQ